jgi:tetratricopeptide (TPR) repeat protein
MSTQRRADFRLAALLGASAYIVGSGTRAAAQRERVPYLLKPVTPAVFAIEGDRVRGTGFFVRADGLAATAYHIIAQNTKAKARLESGREVEIVGVVSVNPKKDTALIQLSGGDYPTLRLGKPASLKAGDTVWALGYPDGKELLALRGPVPGFRTVTGVVRQLLLEVRLHPSMNGGPVFDTDGRVVGIASLVAATGDLAYAVAVDEIDPLPSKDSPLNTMEAVAAAYNDSPEGLFDQGNRLWYPVSTIAKLDKRAKEACEASLSLLLRALEKRKDFPDAHFNAGLAYEQLGKREEAVTQYRKAVALCPDDVAVRVTLAQLYMHAARWTEAEREAQEAVRVSPAYGPAHYVLGRIYEYWSRYQQARAEFETALQLRPANALFHTVLGRTLERLGERSASIDQLKRAIAIRPDLALAHYELGLTYFRAKRNEEGLARFKEAARLKPDDPLFQDGLGTGYAFMGDYKRARQVLATLKKLDPKRAKQLESYIGNRR